MEKLLEELQKLNIKIKLVDGNIKILASNGKLSKEIINKIKAEKNSLLEYLTNSKEKNNKILTPSDLTYKKLSIVEVDEFCEKFDLEDIYKLTPMQEGMLFHTIHDLDSSAYFEQMSYRLEADISVEIMRNSLNELFKRYDVLRTIFVYKDLDVPLQIVLRNRDCGFIYKDIRDLNTAEKELYIEKYKNKDRSQGFVFDQEPLMRVSLLQLDDNEFELIWSHHHIIMDGWCISLINNDFFEIYNSLKNNRVIDLPVRTPYKEYLKWLDQIDKNDSLKYWEEYLNGYEEKASLPNIAIKDRELKLVQEIESINFSKEQSEMLKKIVEENNVTFNTVVQCLWSIVLGKYCVKQDVVFGSVVSGRPSGIHEIETMVGLFLNNIPVRISYLKDEGFNSLLKRVQSSNLDSEPHHYISLAEIQSQSLLKQNLIDHIIVFENFPIAEKIEKNGNEIEDNNLNVRISGTDVFEQTNYNLTINVSMGRILKVNFIYNSNVYDSKMMIRLKAHFENAFNQVVDNSEQKISEIELLSPEEKHQLLYEFNDTKVDYPKDKTIHHLFEESVTRYPENIAVTTKDHTISYKELGVKSNKLAKLIRSKGINPGSVVGIMLDRSEEMIVGLMGILNAGCSYLPIMPNTPKSRVEYFITNSECNLILTQAKYIKSITKGIEYINLEELETIPCPELEIEVERRPNDLAYIIYTSGTTGNPKGVMIENHSVVNRIMWMQKEYPIEPCDVIMQKTPYTFDVSVWELFWWSFNGASVFMLEPEGEKDPILIAKTISDNKINVMHFVPSMLEAFLNLIEVKPQEFNLGSIKYVFSSGEALKAHQVEGFYNLFIDNIHTKLINLYGPTEATVDVSVFECLRGEDYKSIPIGRPIDNTQLYVLDNQLLNVQPVGVAGELMISGVGLSRGYVKEEKLTAEKFIPHPFKEGERLYRTGDLARWLPNGNIEFLGRIDHQVKIRGFRIELGEIESTLLKHENIKESVVIAREENGDKYLCAYLVCEGDFDQEALRDYLVGLLPTYMVPAYFVELDELPLTTNGKINRKALPSPEIKADDDYVAPTNEIEEKLVAIWSSILNIPQEEISITANFFAIGGHSLKASILIGKIHKEIGVEFLLRDVFIYTTIQSQSNQISQSKRKDFISISKAKDQSYYSLSSAQKRLYLLQQLDLSSKAYNMPGFIELDASVDYDKVEKVFQQLILRHESFRTSFEIEGEEPVQKIHDKVVFKIEEYKIQKSEEVDVKARFAQAFDLSQAPLLRVAILEIEEERRILMIDMHHIISDGVSHVILEKEFNSLMLGEVLPPLSLQYKDYSEWQNSAEQQEEVKDQEIYWTSKFEGDIPVLNIPTDYVRPLVQSNEGATVGFTLSKEETDSVRSMSKEHDLTLYMSLLSVFTILLSKLSGQEDIIVGCPIAGRNHSDLDGVVGVFVNTLAIRNEVKRGEKLKEYITRLRETTLGAYENQSYQYEDLVEKVSVERDMSRNPIFDVMFNLLNQSDKEGDLSGFNSQEFIHTYGISKFDLSLTAVDYGDQLMLRLNYCTKLFKADTIERYIGYFKHIVSQLSNKIESEIYDIEILSLAERHQLLYEFNDTKADYPKDKTIHQLFEEQVDRTPENKAICCDGEEISYKELSIRTNKLANYLLNKRCVNKIVGVMTSRSIDMIVGIFGVLKSGNAYLPIDLNQPQERNQKILKESQSELILVGSDRLLFEEVEHVYLGSENIDKENEICLINKVENTDLAYVIYTSGSTGVPKGVMVTHGNIVNFVTGMVGVVPKGYIGAVLSMTTISFDIFGLELYLPLLRGASMILVKEEESFDVAILSSIVRTQQVKVLQLTPSRLNLILSDINSNDIFEEVEVLLVGGEVFSEVLLSRLRNVYKGVVYNMYGPTETTIWSMFKDVSGDLALNIGKPISNTQIFILDNSNKLQPIGVQGELCIGGAGLAQGYLRNPELTAEKFIPHPFKEGERLYRTGDLARWLPSGNIEFLGRIDYQVKIRGFRIELGEIENALLKHKDVKEVVVLVNQNENIEKELVAYICLHRDIDTLSLKTFLEKSLPNYMIPSFFVHLEEFPLTQNGKIDRKILPKMNEMKLSSGLDYVEPQNWIEARLVEIWEDLLNSENIGVNDNFFRIGGNSLRVIKLNKLVNEEFSVQLNVVDLFNYNTINKLADLIISCQNQDESDEFKNENIEYNILKF